MDNYLAKGYPLSIVHRKLSINTMLFEQFSPGNANSAFIECFWIAEDKRRDICRERIIPDGFTEIIIHYGDPYRINIDGKWQIQSKHLLAGQISNHFFIENTGWSGMLGIKFRPSALTHLFDLDMGLLTDKVIPVESKIGNQLNEIILIVQSGKDHSEKVRWIDMWFSGFIQSNHVIKSVTDKAVDLIFEKKGMITVKELTDIFQISERQLERHFKKFIGLSPKFFSRIIRFNYIFKLMKEKDRTWTDVAFSSGFFDQSHFIKNFKEFTGEDPSSYLFDQQNMANFFLKR